MTFLHLFFWLVVGHAIADYPLQGDFLARAKNHLTPIPGVPWTIALFAHATIHAGAVALVTGSVLLGLAELVVHAWVDASKNNGAIGFGEDQAVHIGCKLLWAAIACGVL